MVSTEQIKNIQGGNALDSDGGKIGSIGQIYLDDQSGQPEWATVKTGLFGNSESFIPLHDANIVGNDVTFPYSKDKVKDAPRVDAEQHLDVEQEQELYRYYGISDANSASQGNDTAGRSDDHDQDQDTEVAETAGAAGVGGTAAAGGGGTDRDVADHGTTDRYDTDRGVADHAQRTEDGGDGMITRHEEQLHVGTETVSTGKARLRKFITTEDVTRTVPVSHEEVRVVREPITEENRGAAMSGGDLTEEEHEVTLHAEQAVVHKETVPVERVKLDTETVTGEQEVTEQVRKEHIDVDGGQANESIRGRDEN